MFVTRNYDLYVKGDALLLQYVTTLCTFVVHCTLAVAENTLPDMLARRVNNAHLAPTTEK